MPASGTRADVLDESADPRRQELGHAEVVASGQTREMKRRDSGMSRRRRVEADRDPPRWSARSGRRRLGGLAGGAVTSAKRDAAMDREDPRRLSRPVIESTAGAIEKVTPERRGSGIA